MYILNYLTHLNHNLKIIFHNINICLNYLLTFINRFFSCSIVTLVYTINYVQLIEVRKYLSFLIIIYQNMVVDYFFLHTFSSPLKLQTRLPQLRN